MSSDSVFYWRRWPRAGARTGVPYRRLIAGRVEQAAHFAYTLQNARRHSAHQRRIHGEYVMIAYRLEVRKSTPFECLSHSLGALGSDEDHIGVAGEHRFLVDCRRQRGEFGKDIVAAAQRQNLADHMRA